MYHVRRVWFLWFLCFCCFVQLKFTVHVVGDREDKVININTKHPKKDGKREMLLYTYTYPQGYVDANMLTLCTEYVHVYVYDNSRLHVRLRLVLLQVFWWICVGFYMYEYD